MVVAKFHIVGEKSPWYKTRVQEEITAQGLEGSVMDAGEDKLVLVVEGKSGKIKGLYDNLNSSIPEGIALTEVVFKHTKEPLNSNEVLELLREIASNTRRINQKLDALMNKPRPEFETKEPSTEEDAEEESSTEEATSSFAAMFGD